MNWLSNIQLEIVHKNKNGTWFDENNMNSKLEVTNTNGKIVFQMELLYDTLHIRSQTTIGFYGIRF